MLPACGSRVPFEQRMLGFGIEGGGWLIEHKQFGPLVRDFLLTGAVPLKGKVAALTMIWISFPVSAFFLVEAVWLKVLLMSTAAAVTLYLLYLPTAAPARKAD